MVRLLSYGGMGSLLLHFPASAAALRLIPSAHISYSFMNKSMRASFIAKRFSPIQAGRILNVLWLPVSPADHCEDPPTCWLMDFLFLSMQGLSWGVSAATLISVPLLYSTPLMSFSFGVFQDGLFDMDLIHVLLTPCPSSRPWEGVSQHLHLMIPLAKVSC